MVNRVLLLAVLAAALLLLPAAASAVPPRPGAMAVAHLHGSHGHDYHVELDVDKTGKKLSIAVLYLEECHGTTASKQNVPLGADGSFSFTANLPNGAGTWSLSGSFIHPARATGQASMTRSDCAVTNMPFDASTHSGHVILGNPNDYPPKAIGGSSADARFLQRLHQRTLGAMKFFATPALAARRGYVLSNLLGCPGLHHARKHGTSMWGKVLEPTAPQALVYWCDKARHWTPAAFMFRAPAGRTPDTHGGLLQWHKHNYTADWMTHVWLVPSLTGAFATCAPFRFFGQYSVLTYTPFLVDTMPDKPCGDTPGLVTLNEPTN